MSSIVMLISATLRLATPLIFAALGGVFSEKSGVVNIALEGIMTTGAFFAVYGSHVTGNPWMGILFAIISGAIMAAIHAYLSIHLKADQIVSGVGINVFAAALTSYLIVKFFKTNSQTSVVKSLPYPTEAMGKVPVIGGILKELNWFVFIAIALVIISHFVLYKTPLGLRIRSVGEHPKAADTLGISVYGIRYLCVILSGVLGALGGATLSIGIMNLYRENMVSGRGFIALAAMIFGNWKPVNAMWASMLFAFAETFQLFAKGFGWAIPGEFYAAFPYIITMFALAGFVGKTQAPAADGVPYQKGQR
ncbi:sugar ABC transporter permease [Clostridium tetani]|uniref:Ribose transport system permease protein rbsC n=1 Tax=Clostridium tetani (strain Massachusetts / E88) TaxID=212717 RepID=Q898S0_CLOTE|nr:ABC transporter permease [Clostridium tetani]AAO35009.1 ribose transport system permease protein rbsC [Clostridium tetani E88]KGI37396.1 branched-chain amino acid ABC transporter permease [Clostridium tetani ATCC 9441]KGI40800.1 branched-chain amino acid ABC transporter permease [Clostridium tetani]KGI44276.1 branched-chain amino acid ABC transporter permease [Clostridium tetani]KGI44438.1 branched-chain amino acid ABC transporter permease [Clostridium tetani]